MSQRSLLIAAVAAFFIIVLALVFISGNKQTDIPAVPDVPSGRTIYVAGQGVRVTVVDTMETRRQGLSGRLGLAENEGMLFVFPKDGAYAFWMKDMLFSIDIAWLSAEGKVVYMAQNVSPDTYPHNFTSQGPARYVLELPAGFLMSHNVKMGDIVRL